MRKNKIAVCLMTALLLPVMALTELVSMQEENYPLSAEILTSAAVKKSPAGGNRAATMCFCPAARTQTGQSW